MLADYSSPMMKGEGKVSNWSDDADYPRADWVREVVNGDTQRGYWEWVEWCRKVDDEEKEATK